ncbi:MAG: hypothetical protein RML84_10895 [Anaerolineae bacterium]|nr:hypothetical protein [Anaerolineae bacterium]
MNERTDIAMNERIPKLKVDLDAPGTFALFAKLESANTLKEQYEAVKLVLAMFSEPKLSNKEVERIMEQLSVKDVRRVYEAITQAAQSLRDSPL